MSEITPNTPNPVREDAYVEELSEKLGIDPQYIPKSPVWRNEEEIKAIAEMFANMSSGGGVLVVHDVDGTLDKTWQEIHDALAQGIPCVTVYTDPIPIRNNVEQGQIVFVSGIPGNYYVSVLSAQGTTPVVVKWTATSADGYPASSTGGGDVG